MTKLQCSVPSYITRRWSWAEFLIWKNKFESCIPVLICFGGRLMQWICRFRKMYNEETNWKRNILKTLNRLKIQRKPRRNVNQIQNQTAKELETRTEHPQEQNRWRWRGSSKEQRQTGRTYTRDSTKHNWKWNQLETKNENVAACLYKKNSSLSKKTLGEYLPWIYTKICNSIKNSKCIDI